RSSCSGLPNRYAPRPMITIIVSTHAVTCAQRGHAPGFWKSSVWASCQMRLRLSSAATGASLRRRVARFLRLRFRRELGDGQILHAQAELALPAPITLDGADHDQARIGEPLRALEVLHVDRDATVRLRDAVDGDVVARLSQRGQVDALGQ